MEHNIAWGYARVSTDKQDTSAEIQEEKIRQYCLLNDIFLERIIVEKNISGKIPLFKRPQGSLIKDAKVQHVVILKLDRGFRNTVDALLTMEYFNDKKISLHIIDFGGTSLNTKSSIGELMLTMISAFAQLERRMIGERTKAGLNKRAENGMTYSNISPFGYKKFSQVKGKSIGLQLIPVPEEQVIIDSIERYTKQPGKMSLRQMASQLPNNPRTGKPMYPKLIAKIMRDIGKKAKVA